MLRLFAGESPDALSRESGVSIDRLESRRRNALEGIDAGLTVRAEDDPVRRRLDDANRRIGELTVEVDILRDRVAKQGPFRGRRLTK